MATANHEPKWLSPGSDEAVAHGCRCPVIDNARGRGWMGGMKDKQGRTIFIYSAKCPLHGNAVEQEVTRC